MCDFGDFATGGITSMAKGSPDYEKEASKAATRRNRLIKQGKAQVEQAFVPFDTDFYRQRVQSYINYALPQLGQQYRTVGNAMQYGYANKGIQGGSAAQQGRSRLNMEMGTQKQAVVDEGTRQAQELQRDIEAQKSGLMQQLYTASDPASASAGAVNVASSFRAPSTFTPLTNMFGNLLNMYASTKYLENPNTAWQAPQYTTFGSIG